MRYYVTIEGETVEVDLSGPSPVVGGTRVEAELIEIPGTPLRRLVVDGNSRVFVATANGHGTWRLLLDGDPVDVEVVDHRTHAIRQLSGKAESPVPRTIVAPMPGLVVRVQVEIGQRVSAGQGVIVVEAMKMENELKAPAQGVVAAVRVSPGEAVEKGTTLIELE
jgi:pyruvate carboxylase subunit B